METGPSEQEPTVPNFQKLFGKLELTLPNSTIIQDGNPYEGEKYEQPTQIINFQRIFAGMNNGAVLVNYPEKKGNEP